MPGLQLGMRQLQRPVDRPAAAIGGRRLPGFGLGHVLRCGCFLCVCPRRLPAASRADDCALVHSRRRLPALPQLVKKQLQLRLLLCILAEQGRQPLLPLPGTEHARALTVEVARQP